jgi:hypothetical protein
MRRRAPLRDDDPGLVVVTFPLRGEWRAVHTPAQRVPSHGVDLWAQTYAYDFWRTQPDRRNAFHHRSTLRYWLRGVHLKDCPGFGAPIHAVFDGVVERAGDGMADRDHLHPVLDLLRVVRNAFDVSAASDPWRMTGNHVVVRHASLPDCYALYAHLRRDSLRVGVGDEVSPETVLGEVGHTGNSTAPHLHFQLMTAADPLKASGIPCGFQRYERFGGEQWEAAEGAVPRYAERIRSAGQP